MENSTVLTCFSNHKRKQYFNYYFGLGRTDGLFIKIDLLMESIRRKRINKKKRYRILFSIPISLFLLYSDK